MDRENMRKLIDATALLAVVIIALLLLQGCAQPRVHLLDRVMSAGCKLAHVSEATSEGRSNVEVDCK